MKEGLIIFSSAPEPRHRLIIVLRGVCIAAIVGVLSVLLLVQVDGLLPDAQLDLSWPYTLADATARHIPFGRDMVFTFGPLSSVYTRFFLPDQRLEFTILKLILVVAFCFATVAITRRSMRWATLALPLLFANLYFSDSFFLVAPWLIVPLATMSWQRRRWHTASLVAFSIVLGPLLLVKGTFAIPLVVSIGAAALMASRRSWTEAAALPVAAVGSIIVAWVATGQHLSDLLFYLRRESYIAQGYTDAMSLFGDTNEIWAYLAGVAVLLIGQFVPRRGPVMPALAGAVILSVAFKAGFVRHDTHAMIAASTLILLGFLLFLYRGGVGAGFGLLISLMAWCLIGAHYWPVDPKSDWNRTTDALVHGIVKARNEAGDLDEFRRSFEEAREALAATAALPPTSGIVDLYPNSQALLLASNRDYYPRPVMQSYSAYTPELAFLNAAHLEGPHAPDTAFFAIEPLDGRYPALEDGPSWPALLGQYRFRTYSQAYAQTYAVLDRAPDGAAGTIDVPVSSETYAFDEPIAIPGDMPFVWVKMQFHPTLLGRVASALFKMSPLHMDVTTANGTTQTFRIVAGMASAGFLLSPAVTTPQQFVALRSTDTYVLAAQRVTSITVRQGRHDFWGGRFDLQLAALHIPTDPGIDDMVLGHLEDGPPVDALPVSGACAIERVGTSKVGNKPVKVTGKTVSVTGWGFVSPAAEGHDGGNLRLTLTQKEGSTVYAKAERQARPDMDAYFHVPQPTHTGFTAQVNLLAIDGLATLRVVQNTPAGPAVCGNSVTIAR